MTGADMKPYEIIYQNFPHCIEYRDDSFLGLMHGERRVDMDSYWKLEWAVVQLTQIEVDYPRHLSWPVFRIFSHVMRLLGADSDPQDGYKIKGFDGEKNRDFTERVQIVFEGFFRGEQHDLKQAFDERNPLLV
jgi:hypothetical protein